MPAPTEIKRLVERFEEQKDVYRSPHYNEAQVRDDFLNPLFQTLGWDINNVSGYAQAYRDVIKEDSLEIAGAIKAPDLSFRIGGTRKFFVEAKRPSIVVKDATQPAFQLRRYAWSAKLPLSILTDFEEFAVYDCRIKPEKDDPASKARVFYCTFQEFEEKWDWIASIFSRDSVLKGSFDKYAETNKAKRGTSEVDADFLATIETWRRDLARTLALRNPHLIQRELNFAVQRIIDRIIFLRMCEDRGIENYGRLLELSRKSQTYSHLCAHFRDADARYNSGLFHFQNEKDRHESPDSLTLGLVVEDKLLQRILRGLYYPDSPYEFRVISADILGQVYEQFLGKVIRLTSGHRAVIEDKPEVRKAGGVYYTPAYIVDYMVHLTIKEQIEGKTPKQIESFRVLDPACGSGSFLIAAYQYLLDWHYSYYIANDPKRWSKGKRPVLVEVASNAWRLTLDERKRILRSHIFGVDIDAQAVEVTKLSLLLKVLEGETERTIQPYLSIFRERALPDLGDNIKCGNSLIGRDIYQNTSLLLSPEEEEKINVFDWAGPKGFPAIMAEGGFDVVIGNPPYIFAREQLTAVEKSYFSTRFQLSRDKQNTFSLFMEALLHLTRKNGLGTLIVPNSWLTIESAEALRVAYVDRLKHVADLPYPVFRKVSMEPCIFVIAGRKVTDAVRVVRAESRSNLQTAPMQDLDRSQWSKAAGTRISFTKSNELTTVLESIRTRSGSVGRDFDVRTGLQAYEKGKGTPPQTAHDVANHVFDATKKVDKDTYRYLGGRDVSRYYLNWSGMWMRYGVWLSQPRDLEMFTRPRVLLREITAPLPYCMHACFVDDQHLNNKSILNVLHPADDETALKVLAAVLNSRLMSALYKGSAVKSSRKLFPKVVIRNLREFPFPRKVDSTLSESIVTLHDRITRQCETAADQRSPHDKEKHANRLDTLNQQLDQNVYKLFGLSAAEIIVIEANTLAK